MNDRIYLIDEKEQLTFVEVSPPKSEKEIQALLADFPDLLPGYQLDADSPRRWILVEREVGIPDEPEGGERWSLDHLFLDQDGTPTLVEVKRADNYQIRREVVGQLLDYAANAVSHWKPQDVRGRFERTCRKDNKQPADVLAELLECSAVDTSRMEAYWEEVYRKLKAGELRLVFVADEIPRQLEAIIEFMNLHMHDIEVVGVALPQYTANGQRLIVPQLVGRTATAEQAKVRSKGIKWDEPRFMADIEARNGPIVARTAKQLLDWAQNAENRIWWGEGKSDGSFMAILQLENSRQQLFSVYTYGRIEFLFQYFKIEPFDDETKRLQFMQKLNDIEGFRLDEARINARPSIPLEMLVNNGRLSRVLEAYEWFIGEIKASANQSELA